MNVDKSQEDAKVGKALQQQTASEQQRNDANKDNVLAPCIYHSDVCGGEPLSCGNRHPQVRVGRKPE